MFDQFKQDKLKELEMTGSGLLSYFLSIKYYSSLQEFSYFKEVCEGDFTEI